jgi:hypothetical protein
MDKTPSQQENQTADSREDKGQRDQAEMSQKCD